MEGEREIWRHIITVTKMDLACLILGPSLNKHLREESFCTEDKSHSMNGSWSVFLVLAHLCPVPWSQVEGQHSSDVRFPAPLEQGRVGFLYVPISKHKPPLQTTHQGPCVRHAYI